MNKSEVKKRNALLKFIAYVILPTLIIVPLVNNFFKNPDINNLVEWYGAAIRTGNYDKATEVLEGLIDEHPTNIRFHRRYIVLHYDESRQRHNKELNKNIILKKYVNYSKSIDPNMSDIGFFGLGQIYSNISEYEKALDNFEKVKNKNLRYLNHEIGIVHNKLKQYKQAKQYFTQEIDNGGYIRGSLYYLAKILLRQKNYQELTRLYEDPKTKDDFPNSVARDLHLRDRKVIQYMESLVIYVKEDVNLIGIMGAVFIVIVWLYFLRRLDIFEPEKLMFLLMALAGGMLSIFLALFIYDIYEYLYNFKLNGNWLNDLFYCILGIGFAEELAKILPLLFIMKFTKQVNESIDFIIYASASALGFSFVENLIYFDEYSLYIINERGMICSIGHMFYTSLIAYGIILARYRKQGNIIVNVVVLFFLASAIHGIYDYWIIAESMPKVLSILMVIIEVLIYNRIINNALNQSEYFEFSKVKYINSLREYLGAALMAIVLFEYVCLAWKNGPQLAFANFRPLLFFNWYVIWFLSFNLGNYTLKPGKWNPLWANVKETKKGNK